jgi:adenylate kinase family enzyme
MVMKIFIVGLPKSGRTTVAKSLIANETDWYYIDAISWVRSEFRECKASEHLQQYEDDFQQFFTKMMLNNPSFITDRIYDLIDAVTVKPADVFVIDGIAGPKELTQLFDYRQDVIVFLNRIGNETEFRDHENIGLSVMRDYCFWMASAGLLSKDRWLEYNFKIPGEESESIKVLGSKNSVFIVKSIGKVISHLQEKLREIRK